jgi:hypothetical protein
VAAGQNGNTCLAPSRRKMEPPGRRSNNTARFSNHSRSMKTQRWRPASTSKFIPLRSCRTPGPFSQRIPRPSMRSCCRWAEFLQRRSGLLPRSRLILQLLRAALRAYRSLQHCKTAKPIPPAFPTLEADGRLPRALLPPPAEYKGDVINDYEIRATPIRRITAVTSDFHDMVHPTESSA